MARAWISFICANSKTIHSALNDHQHPHPLEDIVESFRARLAMPSGLNIDDHVDVTLERLQRALGRLEVIKNFEFIEKDDLLKELKGVSRKSLVLALHPKNSDLRVPLPLSPAEMLLLGEIPIGRGLLIPLVAGCACDLKMFFKHADLLKVHQFISLQSAVTVLWKEHINKSIHCQEDHLNSPLLEIPKAIHLATASDSARRTQMISAWVAKNILSDAKHSLAKSLMAGKIDGLTIDAYALLLAEASGISNNRIRAIPSTLFCDYLKYNQCPMIVWKHFERRKQRWIKPPTNEEDHDILTVWPLNYKSSWILVTVNQRHRLIQIYSRGLNSSFIRIFSNLAEQIYQMESIESCTEPNSMAKDNWKINCIDTTKQHGWISSELGCLFTMRQVVSNQSGKAAPIEDIKTLLAFELHNKLIVSQKS